MREGSKKECLTSIIHVTSYGLKSEQGRRKHLKLGGARLFKASFFLEKGALSKNKKGTSLFIAKSWGHVPPVPPVPPDSYFYASEGQRVCVTGTNSETVDMIHTMLKALIQPSCLARFIS